jgi:hypothetical protein
MFVTSGTGVFNKYAKDESRHKDAVIPMSLLAHASVSGSKNVISNRDWLDGMPSDDDDDNEDEDKNEDEYRDTNNDNDTDDNDNDNNEMEHEPSRKNSVAAATIAAVKKDIINIDDI